MAIAPFRMACGSLGRIGTSRALTLEEHTGKTSTRPLRWIMQVIPLSYTSGRCSRFRGRLMSSPGPRAKSALRILAVFFGAALLAYLIERAGPAMLLQNTRTIGWGMLFVIVLAGISHIVKTWAWRLALLGEAKKVSFRSRAGHAPAKHKNHWLGNAFRHRPGRYFTHRKNLGVAARAPRRSEESFVLAHSCSAPHIGSDRTIWLRRAGFR